MFEEFAAAMQDLTSQMAAKYAADLDGAGVDGDSVLIGRDLMEREYGTPLAPPEPMLIDRLIGMKYGGPQ